MTTCLYCGAAMASVGYVSRVACPGCGLVWERGGGLRPTPESLRALVERAVDERTRAQGGDGRTGRAADA